MCRGLRAKTCEISPVCAQFGYSDAEKFPHWGIFRASALRDIQSRCMHDAAAAGPTLLHPGDARSGWSSASGSGSQGLPRDLVRQAMQRVRVLALLYAAVFFLAGLFPPLLSASDRVILFSALVLWLPAVISIATALIVAACVGHPSVSTRGAFAITVVFEIVSSYGISASEFLHPGGLDFRFATWIGLSWVAVWILLFTIVVPASPRRAVLAALASITSVPVMAAISF